MGRATLDPLFLPKFSPAELERLDAMAPDDIDRQARADPDNLPSTPDELMRLSSAAASSKLEPVADDRRRGRNATG